MEQALNSTNEQTDSVLSRAKQNFVPSSKQLIKDTVEMITNPVQTAKSLYELGSGIVQLAIPGEQGNEDTARAVGQHFADRYGSIEKAKETFATDPAGFAVDALGVITGGASLGVGVAKAGAKAVSKVGRKVDVDDGVADAQLQAARESRAKELDRSGMGDLGDGIQPSLYDEALEVSDKYGNNSIFKDGDFDADEYLTYMDDTKELRNSSTIPNDYGLSAKEFLETLSIYSNKNIIKYEGASYESPGFLSELKSRSNKDPWYHIKENGDVILHADRSLERPVLGKPKRKKTLKISGGKKQTTKEEILEFLDIDPKVLKNSLDESVGNSGEYKEILFDMDKLKEQGIARAERLADDGPQPGLGSSTSLEIGTNPALVGGSKLKNYTYEDVLSIREAAKNSTAGTTQANKLINNEVAEGTKIATRLNLNSKIENSVGGVDKLQTLHDKTFNGKALSYMPDVTMTDIVFSVSQKGRQGIAAKVKKIDVPEAKAKHPAMSVDGKYTTKRNVLEEGGNDIVEIGIDPINQHLFIDMNTGQAVKSADIGTVVGSRVYAKGVKYYKKSEAPKPNKASDGTEIPSDVMYKFKKGGTVMGLATGGTIVGEEEGDGLKNPSILDPKTSKEKAKDKDIKKKVIDVAKKPQSSNTNIQTAMLLEPEKLLKKYEKPIMLNEGAMPVTEEEIKEQSTRQQRRSQIINQLDEAGLSVPAIKAIVGNIDIETGGTFNHTQKQEGGNGYGLFQFDFQKPFYDKYLESQNLEDSISSQVSYFLNEISTGDTIGAGNAKSIMDVFNDPKATPKEATIILVDKFFKPGKPHLERRIASAMQGYDEELEGFKEGGLADNADDTPGATESEVADDIPAMISEGELVVPANVVRYHGLSKYENMRKTALKALDELEDNGQIRPVDEDGTPIVKDVKEQTDEVMASKGATVARYNEGGSPKIEEEPKFTLPVERDIRKDLKPVGPRVTPREGQTITPDDSGNKGTLTTPEGKDYRVTNPNTKITATGPRTTKVIGSDDVGGVDFDGIQFGKKRTPVTVSGPSTGEKLLSGITTVAALDKLFNGGKITESVYNWSKENIFDPLGEFLGFDKAATAIKTGPLAGSSIVNGQLTLADGTMDIITSLGGADTVGKAIADGTVISANSYLQGIPANAEIITRFDNASFVATDFDSGFTGADHYAVFKDADGATQTVKITNAQKTQLEAGNSIGGNVVSNDGLFSWKGGLATIGTALSLYDLIENGPSVANVAGTAAGVGGMINAGVFGLSTTAGFGATGLGGALAAYATPLAFVALAAGLVDAFSGPPSNKVAEAAINFDNPEYKESDILVGGFWTKKRSDDNIDAVTQLSASIGSYVSSMEQALEINIGGELFLDVGSTRGLRYGYVDGYDELGMYKYHKKDLDYELLHGQGQTGKGYRGEDAVTDLMNDIQDDTNVVVMFALADKAAGGEGYATYDNLPLYRQKINTLSTYRSGMAGSGTKAVLTDQERNLLEGFQKKEFAEVTGDELAALMPIYDKIAPVQQQNSFNFNSLGM